MVARKLARCPTCRRELPDEIRRAMGLRNGEKLNLLCPGRIGPSDVDHALHNGHIQPERVMFFEYKSNGAAASEGQRRLLRALTGDWRELNDGREIAVRHVVIDQHGADDDVLEAAVEWLFASDPKAKAS